MPRLGCDSVVSHSCAPGYEGNPIQPGGKCRPTSEYCDHVLTCWAGLLPHHRPHFPPTLPMLSFCLQTRKLCAVMSEGA